MMPRLKKRPLQQLLDFVQRRAYPVNLCRHSFGRRLEVRDKNYAHAGGQSRQSAGLRILQSQAVFRRKSETMRGEEKNVGRGLASFHLVSRDDGIKLVS